MTGISILNITSRTDPNFAWIFIFLIFGIPAAIAGGCGWAASETKKGLISGIAALFLGIAMIATTIVLDQRHQQPVYWITTEDAVSVNELNKKYQIIDEAGSLLKVVERENVK